MAEADDDLGWGATTGSIGKQRGLGPIERERPEMQWMPRPGAREG
jgi:hypothetical protein